MGGWDGRKDGPVRSKAMNEDPEYLINGELNMGLSTASMRQEVNPDRRFSFIS